MSGVAHASVQESVSNPKVAFLLSYLEAWNLQSGMDLRGGQELLLKRGQRAFSYIFAHLSAPHVQWTSHCGPEQPNRKSPGC